ncbi:MAG: hypothetical protein Q9181_003347 [Wetmoreana brouardii]
MTASQWVNNYNFVVDIRLSSLSLTASLYASQLRADLILMQTSVLAAATRIIIQSALQRYNYGNTTDANWARAITDLQSALSGPGSASMLVQGKIVSKNGTGVGGPYGLINTTSENLGGQVTLPYLNPDGSKVYLGDNDTGYPPTLYPNLTFTSTVLNDTFNVSTAYFNGVQLYTNTTLFLGPLTINSSLTLVSITAPIINNTSAADILGWLTMVINGSSLYNLRDATNGLGRTGEILIVGPTTQSGKLPRELSAGGEDGDLNRTLARSQPVTYILPPIANSSRSNRHTDGDWIQANTSFAMQQYPTVLDAYAGNTPDSGSLISTKNEEGKHISSGYALVKAPMVDWLLLVEQSYDEVHSPIDRLRKILVACVFGTAGLLLILVFPIAHLSVRPIRRLQEATKRTVEPYRYADDGASVRSSISANHDEPGTGEADDTAAEAEKEGFMGRVNGWREDRRRHKEQRERHRRRTFRIPGKVQDRKHVVQDELTDLTKTFNEMSEELTMQYGRLEERVRERTAQLEISKKAAEAANESKTLFIANISHELKTPLNGILGMCAVCMQEDDQTKIKRSLGIIYKSGDLLLHLLTDLLQFSRNQIGQQLTLDEQEFRLVDVSNQILSIFDKQAKEESINFSLAFQGPQDIATASENTPMPLQSGFGPWGTGRISDMMLWGDHHRILQVVINLVSNSLKFTPPGGSVYVRIKCIGEQEDRPLSRKGSQQSKQSSPNSQRSSRKRGRIVSASESSTSRNPLERDNSGYSDTALQINPAEPKSIPTIAIQEQSSSPPPKGARVLTFEFEVEDTGPGIPEAQQSRVFEPFVQGDLGLSKKYGGTGLGLSICSQLAALMKGSIRLSSQVGVGSKFTMQIPLIFTKEKADSTTESDLGLNSRRNSINVGSLRNESSPLKKKVSTSDVSVKSTGSGGPTVNGFDTPSKPRLVGLSQPFFATSAPLESPNQQMAAIERVAAQASQSGDKVRVLVAEDNKVNQEVVLRMLKLEDIYDVTVAKDGQEAYDLVKASMEERNYFNLIFMDVQMPNLDGLQSTRLIRGMGYSAPIVALTAFAEESNVKECMDSGMDFFLPKPIRRPALKQVLKKYCATIPEAVEPEPEKTRNDSTVGGDTGTQDKPVPPKTQTLLEVGEVGQHNLEGHQDSALAETSSSFPLRYPVSFLLFFNLLLPTSCINSVPNVNQKRIAMDQATQSNAEGHDLPTFVDSEGFEYTLSASSETSLEAHDGSADDSGDDETTAQRIQRDVDQYHRSFILHLLIRLWAVITAAMAPQLDPPRNRLPSLFEVLARKTTAPVDLFSFYIYMRDQQRSVDYLDFWLDVAQHTSLCRHYVRELRRSVLIETPELEKTGSKRSSYVFDHMGELNDPAGPSTDLNDDEKIKDQNLSAYLRENTGGSNHSPQSSLGSQQSAMRAGGERLPRPSFRSRNSPTRTDSDSPGHTVARADIRASAEKILYTYLLPGSEREVVLPQGIVQAITTTIEEEGRDDPEVFDTAKDYTFQAMERDAFPGFLRSKALGNLVPPSMFLRLITGILMMFAGFWMGFVFIFLDEPKHIRAWVILPFTLGVYLLSSHQYSIDPILALAGFSELTFCSFARVKEPYVRNLLNRRALMVLLITIAIGVCVIVLFIFVPGVLISNLEFLHHTPKGEVACSRKEFVQAGHTSIRGDLLVPLTYQEFCDQIATCQDQ